MSTANQSTKPHTPSKLLWVPVIVLGGVVGFLVAFAGGVAISPFLVTIF